MTHAVTRPAVLRNEPSNVRGRGIWQGSTIATLCKIQSFAGSKADQSDPMLNRILHCTFLKLRCRKERCFLGAERHQFALQHLHVLTLNPVFVMLAFHKNEKIRSENSKSCRYIDFISTIVPVDSPNIQIGLCPGVAVTLGVPPETSPARTGRRQRED